MEKDSITCGRVVQNNQPLIIVPIKLRILGILGEKKIRHTHTSVEAFWGEKRGHFGVFLHKNLTFSAGKQWWGKIYFKDKVWNLNGPKT